MEKLYRVLRENHALYRYENNMLKECGMASIQKAIRELKSNSANLMATSFNWAQTKEGDDFWCDICEKLMRYDEQFRYNRNTMPL